MTIYSSFGHWTVKLFTGEDVENGLDVWNLLRECITHKMSECERRRWLREATKTPTATVMEWWALAALLEENCHTTGVQVLQQSPVGTSFGPVSPVLGCWTIKPDSMFGGLDRRSWKAPRMRRNQQNARISWRIIWPRLKGERVFVRLDLFLPQDTELNTEHREIRLKESNFLSVEFKA